MIGDSIIRIATYVLVAIAILFFLGEIASSVVFIVSAFHYGNALPSVTTTVATVIVTRLAARSLREPNKTMFLNIAAWLLTFHLSIIAGLLVLSYGLVAVVVAFSGVIITMYLVREPPIAKKTLIEIFEFCREQYTNTILGTSVERWALRAFRNLATIMIPDESIEDVVGFVHDHPELNLSVVRFGPDYVLIVPKVNMFLVLSLLREGEIEFIRNNNSLINWVVLYRLPVIKEESGVHATDYRLVRDVNPSQFLSLQSSDCALYSNVEGLFLILRAKTSDNIKSDRLPTGFEARIVAGRDSSVLVRRRSGGVLQWVY